MDEETEAWVYFTISEYLLDAAKFLQMMRDAQGEEKILIVRDLCNSIFVALMQASEALRDLQKEENQESAQLDRSTH